ncbi:hypothetical protein ACHAWU_006380 [Discostella pseudostelligera]|uniref:Uncharacterized protein n=1 Tax=Discostella pseudostelligera TaxID=259834 RepID=A0ABD3N430_9STRA
MTTITVATPGSVDLLSKSNSISDLTEMTDLPSDNDSVCEDIASTTSLDDSNSNRVQQHEDDGAAGNQRRVRFSNVYTREFDVIIEEEGSSRPSYKSLDSTISTFTDTESDIETHISEKTQRKKDKYVQMIQYQINRVEKEKKQQQQQEQLNLDKKKGFRSRVLKPMWKGFLEAASRSPMVMPIPGPGY